MVTRKHKVFAASPTCMMECPQCLHGVGQVGKFPESRCLAIKLPNFGTLSIMNAVYRAYPFLIKEARRKLGKEQADQAIVSSFHLSIEFEENFLCASSCNNMSACLSRNVLQPLVTAAHSGADTFIV